MNNVYIYCNAVGTYVEGMVTNMAQHAENKADRVEGAGRDPTKRLLMSNYTTAPPPGGGGAGGDTRNYCTYMYRARIFKLLRNQRIDSKEPIPLGCVAWRAGRTILFLLDS